MAKHGIATASTSTTLPAARPSKLSGQLLPERLGVSPSSMRCETEVPAGERGDDRVEVGDAYDDEPSESGPESDVSGSESDCCDDHADHDDVETVQCKGAIKPLAEADEYLDDDDWVSQAIHSEKLRRRHQDFKDQSQLDNPPPLVAAFT